MENTESKNKNRLSPLIVFFASLLWAGDGPFRKPLLVGGLGVAFVSFLEHLINSVVALPGLYFARAQFKSVTAKQWAGLLYVGAGASALGALMFVQGAVAMNYNFTIAALLQKLQPIFAISLAVIFLKEKLQPKFWFFALPALLGAYLVTFGITAPNAILHGNAQVGIVGPALAILAALLWAGGTVVGRSLMGNLNLHLVNGMRFVFGLLFFVVYLSLTKGYQFSAMTPLFWRNTLIIALVTGFFALLLYYYGLKNTKASVATLMELGYPLALAAVNWKFLGITLTTWQIAGALILLASVTIFTLSQKEQELGVGS